VTVAGSGEATSLPIELSSAGANSGQAQAAIGASGRGVVAFLESTGGTFQLMATPITCGP
jgi:hypothetical protein